MPIHSDWKSMAQGMKSTYCSGSSKTVCRDFTDGSSVCLCTKGWNVFFATLNKNKWSDTSPRPKSVSETMIDDAIEETVQEFVDWFDESKKHKKRKRHKKKRAHAHVIYTNPPTSHSSQFFHPTNFPHIPQQLPSPNPQFFQLTVGKYTEEEIKEIVEWYESKRKKKNVNVPIKRFEAKTHPSHPKNKILKPNPIHIMPKHMQTVEDVFAETDGEPKWVTLAKKVIASKKANPKMKAYWQKRLDAYKPDCPKVKKK